MTDDAQEDPSLFDQLVEQTDETPEPGQDELDQSAAYRPPIDDLEVS